MKKIFKYFLLAVVFWLVVDWTTVFWPDFEHWLSFMPDSWLFYLGYPLVFSFLIYKKKLTNKKIFFATLVGAFVVEIVFTQNALLFTFPIMLLAIPLAVSIYSFLTFGPKWIVEGKINENKLKLAAMTIVWLLVSVITFVTNTGS